MKSNLLNALVAIVGSDNVLATGDLSAYEKPWRGPTVGKAAAVVRPKSTVEVAAVVKACAAEGTSIVPQGGNTGLVGGSTPDASGTQVVLQLGRMAAIRELDPQNMTVTVEAGCVLERLQIEMRAAGFLFPLSLGAEGSCMVGGNLATNAGGTQVVRYGNARELCLGLEVVTSSGDVLNGLSGLRKDNTGYDLRDLFIGSEGTLGVITAATLKLYPLPVTTLNSWVAVSTLEAAIELLGMARTRLGEGLTGFEVMGQSSLQLVQRQIPQLRVPFSQALPPYSVLIEFSSPDLERQARERLEQFLSDAIERAMVGEVLIAESVAQARQFWDVREHIPVAQNKDDAFVAHDISLTISRIPAFVSSVTAALEALIPGVRIINLGHLGDGNLHFNVQGPAGGDHAAFARRASEVSEVVYETLSRFGGSISAEHGIGATRVSSLAAFKDPTALQLMRAIKTALDPGNLMNPGRVLAETSESQALERTR